MAFSRAEKMDQASKPTGRGYTPYRTVSSLTGPRHCAAAGELEGSALGRTRLEGSWGGARLAAT